jgi:hypothetical protein
MTDATKQKIILLTKIGLVGTAVSIPIGLWAMRQWPNSTLPTAVILTATGLALKEYMLHGGGEASRA